MKDAQAVEAYPEGPLRAALHLLVLPHKAVLLLLPIPGLVADRLHVLLILTAHTLHLFGHGHNHLQTCCCFVRPKVCSEFDEDDRLQW